MLEPHSTSIQDRDGGGPLLQISRRIFAFIQRGFADSGYASEEVAEATLIAVEIVRKIPDQVGFVVNPLGRRTVLRLDAIEDWQRTSRQPSITPASSSIPLPSCSLSDVSLLHDFRNRL